MKKLYALLLVTVFAAVSVLLPLHTAAAGGSMSMTASRTLLAPGATVIIAVYMNGGGSPVNAVKTNLSYAPDKLQYVGVSYTGSAFAINTPDNGGSGGLVIIENGTISPVSGSGLVATVTFRALASSGSTTVGFAGGSALIYDNAEVAASKSGVNLSFGVAAPSSGGGSAAAKPAVPEPPKDTKAPAITAIAPKNVTPFAASISWATDEPTDATVEYGLDTNYGLSVGSSEKKQAHELGLNSSFLTPKTLLHYRVKSVDANGNVSVSTDQTLQLPGIAVTIIVRGSDGQPVAGAEVTLDNQTVVTNSKGQAVFSTSLGNKQVITNVEGVAIRKGITVNKSEKPLPPIELASAQQPADRWMLTSIALAIVVFLLLAFDALVFGSKFFSRIIYRHAFVLHRSSHEHSVAAPAPVAAAVPAHVPMHVPVTDTSHSEEIAVKHEVIAPPSPATTAPVPVVAPASIYPTATVDPLIATATQHTAPLITQDVQPPQKPHASATHNPKTAAIHKRVVHHKKPAHKKETV